MANAADAFPSLAHRLRPLPTTEATWNLGRDRPSAERAHSEKRGRKPQPSALLVDSQSVKTCYEGDERGFHGGKKIKGRSRQLVTDTMGNVWAVHVHAANKADTIEGAYLMDMTLGDMPSVKMIFADRGYLGTFVDNVTEAWGINVHISQRAGKGFQIETKRWVVERTFGWFNGSRRLSKDYEKTVSSSKAMIWLSAMSRALKS
jgi:putative transposase